MTGGYCGALSILAGAEKNTRYLAQWYAPDPSDPNITVPQWVWGPLGKGVNGPVYAMDIDDFGNLYVGGAFTKAGNDKAGDVPAMHIAKYGTDPTTDDWRILWRSLDTGVDGPCYAVACDTDQSPKHNSVYFGGDFSAPGANVAKWEYTKEEEAWTAALTALKAGVDGTVRAMAIDSDHQLFVGGDFMNAKNADTDKVADSQYLAIWHETTNSDGSKLLEWASAGKIEGVRVRAIAISSSDDIYIGGSFYSVAGVLATNFAHGTYVKDETVNPHTWTWTWDNGPGTPGVGGVESLAVDPSSGDVYAAGWSGVKQWNGGGSWTDLNLPDNGSGRYFNVIFAVAVTHSDGHVVAAGDFTGSDWYADPNIVDSAYKIGKNCIPILPNAYDPDAPDAEARNIAIYYNDTPRGLGWYAMQQIDADHNHVGIAGGGPDYNNNINAIAADCSGNVYFGGAFTQVINQNANPMKPQWVEQTAHNVVRWAGGWFYPLDFDEVTGPPLNGVRHGRVGTLPDGVNGEVGALACGYDENGRSVVYVGGAFTTAGGIDAMHLARIYDTDDAGSIPEKWEAMGDVLDATEESGGYDNADDIPVVVTAMVVDGDNNLYAGGRFTTPGKYVAKWANTGGAGAAMGGGVGDPSDRTPFVYDLACDSSDNIYIGGGFTAPAAYLVKYAGGSYIDMSAGLDKPVLALAVDSKDTVYVGGDFRTSASGSAYIAQYQGTWEAILPEVTGPVYAIAVDSGDDVYVAGEFSFVTSGGQRCNNIAKWDNIDKEWTSTGYSVGDSDGDGIVDGGNTNSQQIWALAYSYKNGRLYVGGAFTSFKQPRTYPLVTPVGSTVQKLQPANHVASVAIPYKVRFDICNPTLNPSHDHDHGRLDPSVWEPGMHYLKYDVVLSTDTFNPDKQYIFTCMADGVSAGTEPTWDISSPGAITTESTGVQWMFTEVGVWKANTSYVKGDRVISTDQFNTTTSYEFECITDPGGTTGASEPTWNVTEVGVETIDNSITWKYLGERTEGYPILRSTDRKSLIQYVLPGERCVPVTGIPDEFADTGIDYFMSYWTAEKVPAKCLGGKCEKKSPWSVNYLDADNGDGYGPVKQSVNIVCHIGRIIYVNQAATGLENGCSWNDAYTTLTEALDDARPYDMIWVAKGTYYPTDDSTDKTATFQFKKFLRVYGGFDGTETLSWADKRYSGAIDYILDNRNIDKNKTILSGDISSGKDEDNYVDDSIDNVYHIVTGPGFDYDGTQESIDAASEDEQMEEIIYSTLDGFTLEGGNAIGEGKDSCGGALYIKSIPMQIGSCTFKNNHALTGGAVYASDTCLEFTGVCLVVRMPIVFSHSAFYNNTANSGGAIAVKSANLDFKFCTLGVNEATIGGAVIIDGYPHSPTGQGYSSSNNIYTSIFYANKSTDTSTYDNIALDGSAQISVSYSNIVEPKAGPGFIYPGSGNMAEDAKFVSAGSTDVWAATTYYQIGDVINVGQTKNKYVCLAAGTSGATEPDWSTDAPAIGNTLTDGTVTWQRQYWDPTVNVHVKSSAGHYASYWDATGNWVDAWVFDSETSPTIDKAPRPAPPPKPLPIESGGVEPVPNSPPSLSLGVPWANMGAYGQTIEASKSWDVRPDPSVSPAIDSFVVTAPNSNNVGQRGLRSGAGQTYTVSWIAQGAAFNSGSTVDLELFRDNNGSPVSLGAIGAGGYSIGTASGAAFIGSYTWDIDNDNPGLSYGADYYIVATAGGVSSPQPIAITNEFFTINVSYDITFNIDAVGVTHRAEIRDESGSPYTLPGTLHVLSGNKIPALKAYIPNGVVKFVNWTWTDPITHALNTSTENPLSFVVTGAVSDLTANFDEPYTLTVTSNLPAGGGSSTDYTVYESEIQEITADPAPPGYHFDHWTTSAGGTFANVNATPTDFTMPGNDVTVTAEYVGNTSRTLTQHDGCPVNPVADIVSNPPEHAVVSILAEDHSADHYHFDHWSIDVNPNGDTTIADFTSANTSLTMGTANSEITANYAQNATSTLTLEHCNEPSYPAGPYYSNEVYVITADAPAADQYLLRFEATGGVIHDATWAADTIYVIGDYVTSSDGQYKFRCSAAGVSGSTEPAWNTDDPISGLTTNDGTGGLQWTQIERRLKSPVNFTMPSGEATVTAVYADKPKLTVVNGSPAGPTPYEGGEVVALTASAPAGYPYFVNWTSSAGGTFDNASDPNANFTMPATDVIVTANFSASPTLTVVNGTGGGEYASGGDASIVADAPGANRYFTSWSQTPVTGGATGTFDDATSPNTTFTMPGNSVTVTANYADNPTLKVVKGSPAGPTQVSPRVKVTITADADSAANGYFKKWEDDVGSAFDDATDRVTNYLVPTVDAVVTAVFSVNPELTVVDGTDLGDDNGFAGPEHPVGAVVDLTTTDPGAGMTFNGWSTSDGGTFADESAMTTTYTMPANRAVVTANWVWNVEFAADATNHGYISGANSQKIADGGDCTQVTAIPRPGYSFVNWTGTGGFVTTTDNPLTVTNVTSDMNVTANFAVDPDWAGNITYGSQLSIKTSQFGAGMDAMFYSRPKIAGDYTTIAGSNASNTLKAVTKAMPTDTFKCEWLKYVPLYDKNGPKAAIRSGAQTTAEWLNANPIKSIKCILKGRVRNVGGILLPWSDLDGGKYRLIVPPVIREYTSWDNVNPVAPATLGVHMRSIIILKGDYFGSKPPTVALEYIDPKGAIKQVRLQVIKEYNYTDSKGRANSSCMDIDETSPTYGESQLKVAMPSKWWTDWGTNASYSLVLTNRFGISTIDVATKPAGVNSVPDAFPDTYTLQAGEPSYTLDVLANDQDKEADKLTVALPSKTSDKLAKLMVSKNQVVYKVPKGATAATFPDVFSYTAEDHFGGKQKSTATINVNTPVITDVKKWDGTSLIGAGKVQPQSVLILEGTDFGEKGISVAMEYVDLGGVTQSKKLKITGIPQYADYKGRPYRSYTDLATGISKIQVELPKSFWQGWLDNDTITLKVSNAFTSGSSGAITTTVNNFNSMTVADDAVAVNSGDYFANSYYLIDVMANDSDTYSSQIKIVLSSSQSTLGGKISVDKNWNRVKYTPPKRQTTLPFTDTFDYRLKDKDGNLSSIATVTVTVNPN